MSDRIDETHDPALQSWVPTAHGHPDFPVQNLPYGVFSPGGGAARIGVAIGDFILDLQAAAEAGLLPAGTQAAFAGATLNAAFELEAGERAAIRRRLSRLLVDPEHRAAVEPLLHPAAECEMHLPAAIGDYTDFYVGIHHATRVGQLFRPENPLMPNYKHVPIGYHGRASSIRPSGTPVIRPRGQRKGPADAAPSFGPSLRLDYELELGVWVGRGNPLGHAIPIAEAGERIAGLCLLNDWSARDLQAWEYQPLGPFLGKNFHTTISPWVVTAEALAPFRIAQPPRPDGDPRPMDYLWDEADQRRGAFAIQLGVTLTSAEMRQRGLAPVELSSVAASNMYWTAAQIVTHHASNGCNLNSGDLIGTGTIAGPDRGGYGSILEITRGGVEPLALPTGEVRAFLEDGDEIGLSARASAPGFVSIGFGACRAMILPAAEV
jgi:fumarylacetoacetase